MWGGGGGGNVGGGERRVRGTHNFLEPCRIEGRG
jgi:hypothetical protein